MSSSIFSKPERITLESLPDLFAYNRAIYGGFRMDGDGATGATGATGPDGGGATGATGTGATGATGSTGTDEFPANTPVAEMTAVQQAAYWRHQSKKHESRSQEWQQAAGGKTAAEIKAERDELAKLREQTLSDQEKAVEAAKAEGRAEGARPIALGAARMAFEFALGHDPEKNDQSTLIDTLDLSKVLKEDGTVDTAKVRDIASKIAPADKDAHTSRTRDFGAGDRRTGSTSGVAAGRSLFEERRGKKPESTNT